MLVNAVSGFQVTPYLMLANKASVATADGLNQFFHLSTDAQGRTKVIVTPGLTPDRLRARILGEVPAMPDVQMILEEVIDGKVFSERVSSLAADYLQNNWIKPKLSSNCKDCEFKATAEEIALGKKAGFHECWTKVGELQPNDFSRPSILEVWNFSAMKDFIPVGTYFQDGLSQSDLTSKAPPKKGVIPKAGMTAGERRWLQVSMSAANDGTAFG